MRISLFTNEYPPNVYGGAGVHVEYLSRELARAEEGAHHVDVLCFGEQHEHRGNLRVRGNRQAGNGPFDNFDRAASNCARVADL